MALKIRKHYFTDDGTFGDAREILILDTSNFTPQEWWWIEETSDSDRLRMATTVYVRAWLRNNYRYTDNMLPCQYCNFTDDETVDSGYIWMTCDADDDNGCDWGNR